MLADYPALAQYVHLNGYAGVDGGEISTVCPQCSHPNRKLYISTTQGVGYCHHCNLKGPVGVLFNTPQGTPATPLAYEPNYLKDEYIIQAHRSLMGSEGRTALSYLLNDRALKTEALSYFKLGFDPEKQAIVIPTYGIEDNLEFIKWRYLKPDPDQPKYRGIKGHQLALFNASSLITNPASFCILTEGELDCISIFQLASFLPIVAVPGVNSFKEKWLPYFERFERIYIAFDNESRADDRAAELAVKLNDWRCYRIKFPKGIKDVNDLIIKAGKQSVAIWAELTKEAKCLGTPLTKDTSEYVPQALKYYLGDVSKAVPTGYKDLDFLLGGGFYPGRSYILGGETKTGKTTMCLDLLLNLALQGHKILLGSFEMKTSEEMLPKIASKLLKRDVLSEPRLTSEAIRGVYDAIGSWDQLSWVSEDKRINLKRLYNAVKLKYSHGFRFLFLDHAQRLMNFGEKEAVFSETARVSKFLEMLRKDFPELTILTIFELNKEGTLFGGKTAAYDADVVLNYWGRGITMKNSRLDSSLEGKSVLITWDKATASYSFQESRAMVPQEVSSTAPSIFPSFTPR